MRCCSLLLTLVLAVGCATTKTSNTARTAREQLLISNAIDQSLDKIDFAPFRNQTVFLEEKYLDSVDKGYLIGSIRHRLLANNVTLAGKADDADVVLEVRSGGVGTNQSESFVGVPEIVLPGMMTIPELRFATKTSQKGVAKIGLVAYSPKTKKTLGDGGMSLAQSDDNNWFIMGVGPYKTGSVNGEIDKGLRRQRGARQPQPLPTMVTFQSPGPSAETPKKIQFASEEKVQEDKK